MHPALLSAGSLITFAAAQLITLCEARARHSFRYRVAGIAGLLLGDPSLSWIVANNVGISKFHLSAAMRTAITMHVAKILRDSSPKVMLCPTIDSDLFPTFVIQGKHVAEITKPTKADHGKLGMYEGEYITIR